MRYVSENNCLQILPTSIITLVHLMSSKLGLINAKIIIIMIMMMTLIIFIIILIVIITTIIETIIIIIIFILHIYSFTSRLACSSRSDSRAREKNSRRQKKKNDRALLSERLEQGIRSHSILYTKAGFHSALRAFSIHTGVNNSRCTLTPKDIDNTVIVIKQLPLTLIKVAVMGSFGWGRNL